jgi:esterase/lipase superfamily enzyme
MNWNVERHVVLRKIELPEAKAFWQALDEHLQVVEEKQLLLFVHGFNVSFEDAARRCAQISYDLAFDGPAISYSWPSKATVPGYPADEASVEWSAAHLCSFIQKLLDNPEVGALHVLAHSMGNRAVMRAMELLGQALREGHPGLAHIALAAPDVDAGVFRQSAPSIIPRARQITLYASDNDRALKASKAIHDYRRAGQAGNDILVLPGMDTIDVTALDTDFLGHSYYGDNRSVISDIFYLIRGHAAKERHGLRKALTNNPNNLSYWKFQP